MFASLAFKSRCTVVLVASLASNNCCIVAFLASLLIGLFGFRAEILRVRMFLAALPSSFAHRCAATLFCKPGARSARLQSQKQRRTVCKPCIQTQMCRHTFLKIWPQKLLACHASLAWSSQTAVMSHFQA
jgi:hypothetical protein